MKKSKYRTPRSLQVRSYQGFKNGKEMSFDKIHRGCIDKHRFHNRKAVKNVARQLGLRYYKCDFCGNWHLTRNKGAIDPNA